VRKAFDVHLVGNGTLATIGAGHNDSVAIGGPWGGPVYVGGMMSGLVPEVGSDRQRMVWLW
jgi:hypothetical protein